MLKISNFYIDHCNVSNFALFDSIFACVLKLTHKADFSKFVIYLSFRNCTELYQVSMFMGQRTNRFFIYSMANLVVYGTTAIQNSNILSFKFLRGYIKSQK